MQSLTGAAIAAIPPLTNESDWHELVTALGTANERERTVPALAALAAARRWLQRERVRVLAERDAALAFADALATQVVRARLAPVEFRQRTKRQRLSRSLQQIGADLRQAIDTTRLGSPARPAPPLPSP